MHSTKQSIFDMFQSLSKKGKDRIWDKEIKLQYFHKMKYVCIQQVLLRQYKQSLSGLNIKTIRKQNVAEEYFLQYDEVNVNTLQMTMQLITKLSMKKHSDDEEHLLHMISKCPTLKGRDILQAYAYIACSKSLMTPQYKRQFYLAGEMIHSTTKLLFAFDSIMFRMLEFDIPNLMEIPCQLTDKFWEKVYDFHRDFNMFAGHDKLSMIHSNVEKYRFLTIEIANMKMSTKKETNLSEIILREFEDASVYLGCNFGIFMCTDDKKSVTYENQCLRFLQSYSTLSGTSYPILPCTIQNLSFQSMLILKTHFWKNDENKVLFSTYKEQSIFDLDWDFDDALFAVATKQVFFCESFETKDFTAFSTNCELCFQQSEFVLDFEENLESACMLKKGLSFSCTRIVSYFRRCEAIFKNLLLHMEQDDFTVKIEEALETFQMLIGHLQWEDLMDTKHSSFNVFIAGFLTEMKITVSILKNFQNLVVFFGFHVGSCSLYLENCFERLRALASGNTKIDQYKIFMAFVPALVDYVSKELLVMYNAVCKVSFKVMSQIKDDAFGENMQEVIDYFKNDLINYIEKYGSQHVFSNTTSFIQKLKLECDFQMLQIPNLDFHSTFHHLMMTSIILNPPSINRWPETLWRCIPTIVHIRKNLDMMLRMIWCKELVEKYQIQSQVELIEQNLLEIKPKNNQEETNLSIYEVFKNSLSESGWKQMKVALQEDSPEIYFSIVRKTTNALFQQNETTVFTYPHGMFLAEKISSLRKLFTQMCKINWDIHRDWYKEFIDAT